MAQKSMQAKLDEALSRMAFLEGELTKRGHIATEPAIQNLSVNLQPARKSKGGKFTYAYESKGLKVFVYSTKPLAKGSKVASEVVK
tara:strand:- start:44 stop:301 length:258 start_codon:yes stop_codon:yes gene_type:complete